MGIQVILTNWKRPGNLAQIVQALHQQDVPHKVFIVDNHPEEAPEFCLPPGLVKEVDDVFRWKANSGPPCRFVPAFVWNDSEYTVFLDDDILVGPQFLRYMLGNAKGLGKFATIGQRGLRVEIVDGRPVRQRRCIMADCTEPTDITLNMHLIRTEHVSHAHSLKWQLINNHGLGLQIYNHDDILLSFGIQIATGWPSFIVSSSDPDTAMQIRALPRPFAMSKQAEHEPVRDLLVKMCYNLGWKPVRSITWTDLV